MNVDVLVFLLGRQTFLERLVVFAQMVGILIVVVLVDDLGLDVCPAGAVNKHTGGVKCLCHIVEHRDKALVLIALGFVERTPADDGRMVVVALQKLQPFGEEACPAGGFRQVKTPVAVLAPDDVAELVAVVEEARLKDLLVQSRAVEAHRKRTFDICLQFVVSRCRPDAVRIEALVEHETLEDSFAIEDHCTAIVINVAQTEVRRNRILTKHHIDIIEVALADVPQMLFLQGKYKSCHLADNDTADGAHVLALKGSGAGQRHAVCVFAEDFVVNLAGCGRGGCLNRCDVGVRNFFHPDRLPDTGGSGVGAAAGVEVIALLADRLASGTLVIFRTDGDDVLAGNELIGDIVVDGGGAAKVYAAGFAVDIDLAGIVARTDVEQIAHTLGNLNFNFALVPDTRHEVLVFHAGELRFRAERNGDFTAQGFGLVELSCTA